LVNFLIYNKTGFCEQYSSAMGVMLRVLGIPTRVAIGFTDGYAADGHQTITTQDAHAWDEVYFPGYGWVTFDPTPLSDGRTQVPGFVSQSPNSGTQSNAGRQNPNINPTKPSTTPVPNKQPNQTEAA